jgi:NADPH-dependent 7-cyano-7-deazaguanine reductase QueF
MPLQTITNPTLAVIVRQTHEVAIPALCPKTSNPMAGSTLTITYAPADKLLEVYSLSEYVTAFTGSETVRDLELLTQMVARDCRAALSVEVTVTGKFLLNIGQTLICECRG